MGRPTHIWLEAAQIDATRRARPGHRPDQRLAEWWHRLFSWIIDTIIITALVAALWIPVVHAYIHNYRIMIEIQISIYRASRP
jgi:hypothetical protein